jgi:hypothetical protein
MNASGLPNFSCHSDGYDVVVLLQNAGPGGESTNTRAEPIVYLNDQEDHLVRLDLTVIPLVDKRDDYLVHGFLADMNGDAIEDLIWFRQSRPRINATDLDPDKRNFIRVHFGLKNLQELGSK